MSDTPISGTPVSGTWQFRIDVGGTFTDCIGIDPQGRLQQYKTLSSGMTKGTVAAVLSSNSFRDPLRSADPDGFWTGSTVHLLNQDHQRIGTAVVSRFVPADGTLELDTDLSLQTGLRYELDCQLPAPVLGIRWLMKLAADDRVPPSGVRFGTTRGTNALLTRTGAKTALLTTKGFADVPLIGNQDRPELFDLKICKPEPLFDCVLELDERIAADGSILQPLNKAQVQEHLKTLAKRGIDSVAVCLMNAWVRPQHEQEVRQLADRAGFQEVSCSHEVSPQIRFVPRCDTTVLDAYLNPILRSYLDEIRDQLPGSRLLVMTSAGGLVDSHAFRGRDSILSGPAGGVAGFSQVAAAHGFDQAIGFDMGGTSTDVARWGGRFDYESETTKAGIRIMTPVLSIETVAAGGGSICHFDGVRLHVGPASAGADPGPACYGSGGPLTVTDLNVWLGRVLPEHFPFELDVDAVASRLEQLQIQMENSGAWYDTMSLVSLAEGLLQIANDNMVQAIRRVSVAKGYDPAEHVLVSFGGAGGQHACAVARDLGIRQVLLHPLAGILSAWGMGQADVKDRRTVSVLNPLTADALNELSETISSLASETHEYVRQQGVDDRLINDAVIELGLRYAGTESTLEVNYGTVEECQQRFEQEYQRLFGYTRPDRPIEIAALSVEVTGRSAEPASEQATASEPEKATPDSVVSSVFGGQSVRAGVFLRSSLKPGHLVSGPAIICEPTSTILIEPDCHGEIIDDGSVLISIGSRQTSPDSPAGAPDEADPILLEVFNNQFVSIAEQMGETLRRTSVSTNVRERLDFSCALFDSQGRLVVNAPHVPVHLGAMGETVRAIMQDHPDMQPGDVFVTNDPYRGGSHLPDVTVVTPVFTEESRPTFFAANRAHHAEIGGIVPGSMPPFSNCLAEEGVLIRSCHLVREGQSQEGRLRQLLSAAALPSRGVDDNLADLAAQTAANAAGANLLQQLCGRQTTDQVLAYMQYIQQAASRKMRQALSRLEDREYAFTDQLDDGSRIQVRISVHGETATVDFSGTSGVHSGNLNANRAITTAAVLYSFRCLLNEDVPLNFGVLEPLDIRIPSGLLNPPEGATPEESPAMVGGNVETSQRIVDILLGALQLAAASQGTMNNLTFGDGSFGYYETICGGAGATPQAAGADAVHTHMTNTRLTDPEVLEHRYPVRLKQFCIRHDSGGSGQFSGGNGIIRELEFLQALQVSLLSQRRTTPPWGLHGGASGRCGRNSLTAAGTTAEVDLTGAFSQQFAAGDVLKIETPGGGGCGH